MWILESNGDFLQGKRMWLKPGKKYLFGRVKKDGVRFAIDHKTVSRKHFVITIDPVRDQDVGQAHARSKITITDENSKAGTNIDGKLIKASSQELRNTVNSIRPGSCPHELVITWQPCVMTFMLNKKEIKNGELKLKQDRVKDLDIRAVTDYLTEHTTHLIAQKRNTAKGLQALIEGRPIITEAYIDALIYASTPIDLQEEENLCPLETDFDEAWPDPSLHLPPPGKEPTDKPAEAYRPSPARLKVFDKYTFIFFDQSQYNNLLPPITTGHGKALLFQVDAHSTSIEEGQDFIKDAVLNPSRVIIVSVNESEESRPWLMEYVDKLSSTFAQHPASQSDFLDAILSNDASQLRKPRAQATAALLPSKRNGQVGSHVNGTSQKPSNAESKSFPQYGRRGESSESPASASRASSAIPESAPRLTHQDAAQQPVSQDDNPRPTKRARFVTVKKTRAAFDDDFDPNAIAEYNEDTTPARPQSARRPLRSQDVPNGATVKEEPESIAQTSQSPLSSLSSDDEAMDELLPAAAAMSREKSHLEADARRKGLPTPLKKATAAVAKPEKEIKLLDVRGVVKAQREAEKDQERKEQQELDEYADVEITGPANLVQVKSFELPTRKKNSLNSYKGETWKSEWDGRKNFKGFRRARDAANGNGEPARRREKIIIPLEPYRSQDYGLGDRYWEKSKEEKERAAKEKEKRKKMSQRSQSQANGQQSASSRSQRSDTVQGDSDDGEDSDRAIQISEGEEHQDPEVSRLQAEAENMLDDPVDVDAPRQTRAGETQASGATKSTAATKSSKAGAKRPASKTPPSTNKTSGSKRQKTLPVTVVHGSDSEDGDDSDDLKFKVGRGRRARNGKS